jgi:predicted RecB family nuclease
MQRSAESGYIFSASDLMHFLGCRHCVVLDLANLAQPLEKAAPSAASSLLAEMGSAHERSYLERLRAAGKSIIEIPSDGDAHRDERLAITKEKLFSGADVIYQAALEYRQWAGYADFLIKVDTPSELGEFSYEVLDTKLSRHAEPRYLVQLGVYSDLLAQAQGIEPVSAHLVLGDGRHESFRTSHFSAYVRHAQRRFEDFIDRPPAGSYPLPCKHCDSCHWRENCAKRWEADDHLSLVTNIQMPQVAKIEAHGIRSVATLAATAVDTRIAALNPEVFHRLRSQAILQYNKRQTGQDRYELLLSDPGRGFARLPEPDAGDLFFDMEGDPLHPEGLEYLFGLHYQEDGIPIFKPVWAHDHKEEAKSFEAFMDFLTDHVQAHPNAYIYHYNHYEPTALKKLASKYAVAEHQLDDLLRREKFVDLFKVVRESIRTSEPAYSLKNLETFYMEKRGGAVTSAGDSIVVYNRWRETGDAQLLTEIADYNRVDCESTRGLRDWLLTLRPPTCPWFSAKSAPDDSTAATPASAARQERERRYLEYRERLEAASGDSQDAASRLAELIGFYFREAKPDWWAVYDRRDRFEDELIDDAECLAGVTPTGAPERAKQSHIYTCTFPPQETKLRVGSMAQDVTTLAYAGEIVDLDEIRSVVKIKRGTKSGPLPERITLGPPNPLPTDRQQAALYRVADDALTGGGAFPAITDILTKAPPRFQGRAKQGPILKNAELLEGVTAAVSTLDGSYLVIQGPPGSGKTYTTAHVIVEMIGQGKRIAVAANSHKAIHNVLDSVERMASERDIAFVGIKKGSPGDDSAYQGEFITTVSSNDDVPLNADLVAGTAWLFADDRFDRHFDYLFIDEAGQLALANVVAMGTSARNIVLIGDQMQLGQPVKGVHPGDSGLSILDYLLEGQATVAADSGIFLNVTRRLHPSVCDFISNTFYEGRLLPAPDNVRRQLIFDTPIPGIEATGTYFVPVEHSGCSQKSEKEGKVVRKYYAHLLGQRFQDKDGTVRQMTPDDVLVVAPYNVQVNHLRSILPAGARVGTVDKFQGQEASAVLVSMATSDAENLPRDTEFLFSANRLNVAVSRAECLAIVIASPKLLEIPCKTIEQLRLVNNFCRLLRDEPFHAPRTARPKRDRTAR